MARSVTARSLYDALRDRLKLHWVSGGGSGEPIASRAMRSLRVLVEGAGGGDILSESARGAPDAVVAGIDEAPSTGVDAEASQESK